jgi:hypothetical protein
LDALKLRAVLDAAELMRDRRKELKNWKKPYNQLCRPQQDSLARMHGPFAKFTPGSDHVMSRDSFLSEAAETHVRTELYSLTTGDSNQHCSTHTTRQCDVMNKTLRCHGVG